MNLTEEYLPHQATTKVQAVPLLLTFAMTSGLTLTRVQQPLTLINALLSENVMSTHSLRKQWTNKKEAGCTCTGRLITIILGNTKIPEAKITFLLNMEMRKLPQMMSIRSLFRMFHVKEQPLWLLKQVRGAMVSNLGKIPSVPHVVGARKLQKITRSDITFKYNIDRAPGFIQARSTYGQFK